MSLASEGGRLRSFAGVVAVLVASFCVALYLEFLGWRIIEPEAAWQAALSMDLFYGALRTTAGALGLGLVLVLLGWALGWFLPRLRGTGVWWRAAGSALFLALMGALLAWAPG